MTAALFAARAGASVTILEGGKTPGKKLLATGNGRCNFANREQSPACWRTEAPEAAAAALGRFGLPEVLTFFRSLGLYVSDRGGYLYPRSEQAAAVREALEGALREAGVEILTEEKVTALRHGPDGFHMESRSGRKWLSPAVILACGGRAAPKTGSDGNGYALAASMGHHLIPASPALVPLKTDAPVLCAAWKGTRTKGRVRLLADGKELAADTGELQLTDYGISGIPVFQVSRFASVALREGKDVSAEINFLPEFSPEERKILAEDFSASRRPVAAFWNGLLPGRLTEALLKELGIKGSMPCYAVKGNGKRALLKSLYSLEMPVTGTLDFENAQVTAGGVDLREVNPATMESLCCPGLYFSGEILDVDGICGGYNLQWAWCTGMAAGKAAAGEI